MRVLTGRLGIALNDAGTWAAAYRFVGNARRAAGLCLADNGHPRKLGSRAQ